MKYKLNGKRKNKNFDGYKKNPGFFRVQTIPISHNLILGRLYESRIPPKDWKFDLNHSFKLNITNFNLDAKGIYKKKRDGD
ncbi:MAG: hypothetical protein ACFE94_05365 [Candidatus Hodarchaeota archaeon]